MNPSDRAARCTVSRAALLVVCALSSAACATSYSLSAPTVAFGQLDSPQGVQTLAPGGLELVIPESVEAAHSIVGAATAFTTFGPSGDWYATAAGRRISIWDVGEGKVRRVLLCVPVPIAGIAALSDRALAVGGSDDVIRIVDIDQDRVTTTIGLPRTSGGGMSGKVMGGLRPGALSSLAVSADGTILVATTRQGAAISWDLGRGREIASGRLPRDAQMVLSRGGQQSTRLTPDGKQLVVNRLTRGQLALFDTSTWRQTGQIQVSPGTRGAQLPPSSTVVRAIAVGPRGERIYALQGDTGASATLRAFDRASGREQGQFEVAVGRASRLDVSADGRQIAAVFWAERAGETGPYGPPKARIWDASSGKLLTTIELEGLSGFELSFHPQNADQLLIDGRLYEASSGRQLSAIQGSLAGLSSVAFTPAGDRLVSTSGHEWDPVMGGVSSVAHDSIANTLYAPTIGPWGRWIVGLDAEAAKAVVYDRDTDERFEYPAQGLAKLRIAGTQPYLIGHGSVPTQVWDLSTGKPVVTLRLPDDDDLSDLSYFVRDTWRERKDLAKHGSISLGVSADGRRVAISPLGRNFVFVFSLPDGRLLRRLLHPRSPLSVLLSADGKRLASVVSTADAKSILSAAPSARGQSQIFVWDVESGEVLSVLDSTPKLVKLERFTADNRTIFFQGDAELVAWEVGTSRCQRFRGATGQGTSLSLHPNGRLLLRSTAGSAELWSLSDGQLLATLTANPEGTEWVVASPNGLFDGTAGAYGRMSWRQGDRLMPLEVYFNDFYRPGLLGEILAQGSIPSAPAELPALDRRQPEVELVAERLDPAGQWVDVAVRVAEAPPGGNQSQGSGVSDLRVFRNGVLVRAFRGELEGLRDGKAKRVVKIPLVAGPNAISAYAFNRAGIKSLDAELTVAGPASTDRTPKAHVLTIGIDQYRNEEFNLRFAKADADAFAQGLSASLRSGGVVSHVEVESLANAQATKQNIVGALEALASRTAESTAVQPEDTVFVYYAGHGIAVGDRFYLLPHDLAFRGRMAELSAADVKALVASGISDEELERLFEPIDARIVLVIDACNSGQALETAERRRGPTNARGLAQLAFEKGMYVLTAAQAHQAALEVSNLGHGILTYVLIEQGLEKGQADAGRRDGVIEVREWLAHAVRGVPEQHRKLTQSSQQRGLELVSGVPSDSNLQRPRAFFRRQLEAEPALVGRRR